MVAQNQIRKPASVMYHAENRKKIKNKKIVKNAKKCFTTNVRFWYSILSQISAVFYGITPIQILLRYSFVPFFNHDSKKYNFLTPPNHFLL